ncbi:chemotaxis protein CheD [Clostridium sp. A1-XYC3]|uniref:Probable chemoreceptor glutamine deamidase CheD n=1 Tax=Clostridium tanneri TaxID=3037988 RepID=A0ABU4JP28_9CLOT|nr:chemotaxis protein CheD [Clostridium sp. A1-XYC3]MDW8799716.1 chemotaxis protein CheD [Clostridium sp. A1-XYC3]
MEVKEIKVGIADMNTASAPDRIITVGLGSCIGIAIYDKTKGLGGLAHIMLPDSTQFNNVTNPLKFADLAIPMLIDKLEKLGASRRTMKAKIAGGASMFNFSDKSMIMDIGNRNSIAVKNSLKQHSIPIIAEDVGGNKGRTMILSSSDGLVQIKTVGMGVKEL